MKGEERRGRKEYGLNGWVKKGKAWVKGILVKANRRAKRKLWIRKGKKERWIRKGQGKTYGSKKAKGNGEEGRVCE